MSAQMQEVRLYGWLGEKYGKSFKLCVRDVSHAIRLLSANFPTFRQDVAQEGAEYAVIVGKRRGLTVEQLSDPLGTGKVIKIVPMPSGSKQGGVFQTILGIVLIVVGAIISYGTLSLGAPVGVPMMKVGVALVLSGLAQMLAGTPKAPKSSATDSSMTSSDLFNGATNTSAQGNPFPVCYGGPIIVGSYVASAGYSAVEVPL